MHVTKKQFYTCVTVEVQFYPWLNVYFPWFFLMSIMMMNIKQKKIKIEPRIKLNYNITIPTPCI